MFPWSMSHLSYSIQEIIMEWHSIMANNTRVCHFSEHTIFDLLNKSFSLRLRDTMNNMTSYMYTFVLL